MTSGGVTSGGVLASPWRTATASGRSPRRCDGSRSGGPSRRGRRTRTRPTVRARRRGRGGRLGHLEPPERVVTPTSVAQDATQQQHDLRVLTTDFGPDGGSFQGCPVSREVEGDRSKGSTERRRRDAPRRRGGDNGKPLPPVEADADLPPYRRPGPGDHHRPPSSSRASSTGRESGSPHDFVIVWCLSLGVMGSAIEIKDP